MTYRKPVTQKPIFSLLATRHELGRSSKGLIYVSKIVIGAVCWALLVFPYGTNVRHILTAATAIFITSKVCWYVNTGERPEHLWESLADWVCDWTLHCAWLLFFLSWPERAVFVGAWLATYPWSGE